ncbi:MAG: orotate phosphoribosyltransferase [Bacteriovoracia bacterium]
MSAQIVAEALLKEKAVFLRPEDPFTWASGIKSPIYCDNRLLISKPHARRMIVQAMKERVKNLGAEVIAGTATAGIPWAAWLADAMDLPMVYVRSGAKDHGRKNLIEGQVVPGAKTLLIEDLISTGKSSLAAAEVLEASAMKVLAVVGLFHYNFPQAHAVFEARQIPALALCTLDDMLAWATKSGSLSEAQAEDIRSWRQNVVFP